MLERRESSAGRGQGEDTAGWRTEGEERTTRRGEYQERARTGAQAQDRAVMPREGEQRTGAWGQDDNRAGTRGECEKRAKAQGNAESLIAFKRTPIHSCHAHQVSPHLLAAHMSLFCYRDVLLQFGEQCRELCQNNVREVGESDSGGTSISIDSGCSLEETNEHSKRKEKIVNSTYFSG